MLYSHLPSIKSTFLLSTRSSLTNIEEFLSRPICKIDLKDGEAAASIIWAQTFLGPMDALDSPNRLQPSTQDDSPAALSFSCAFPPH
jgi:hypothetical protein